MSFRGGLYKYNVSTREFVNFTRKTGILMLCLAMVDGDMSRIFCWVVKL